MNMTPEVGEMMRIASSKPRVEFKPSAESKKLGDHLRRMA
jgi:hypothetical protein